MLWQVDRPQHACEQNNASYISIFADSGLSLHIWPTTSRSCNGWCCSLFVRVCLYFSLSLHTHVKTRFEISEGSWGLVSGGVEQPLPLTSQTLHVLT